MPVKQTEKQWRNRGQPLCVELGTAFLSVGMLGEMFHHLFTQRGGSTRATRVLLLLLLLPPPPPLLLLLMSIQMV